MKITTFTLGCLVFCLLELSAGAAPAQSAAFLRANGSTYYVAVKADPPLWNGRDVATGQVAQVDVAKEVIASVYQKGLLVPSTVAPSNGPGSDFILLLPDNSILKGDFDALMVAVQGYPIGKGQTSGFSVAVEIEVAASLTQQSGTCPDGFPLLVQISDQDHPFSDYAKKRLQELRSYMAAVSPMALVESRTAIKDEPRKLKLPALFFGSPDTDGRFFECLRLLQSPPSGTFDIKFTYPDDAPIELRHLFLKTDVANASHTLTPFGLDDGDVGKRAIEQNLDVGVQLNSSVSDQKVKDAAGVDMMVRQRDSKGTLDLRLAPLLNVMTLPDPGSKTFTFLTPLLVDARVSTGTVNEDNLALNRIVIGSEYEIRHYTDPATYPTFQRYILSFRNASDRDFHQAEWKAGLEFQPVFSELNRPLRFRHKSAPSILDQDPDREPKDIPTTTGFGQQFLPLFGVEWGKTWRNKSPFAAIEKTDFVRRLYFGGTVNLDLTAYVRVSAKDILYVRGETKDASLHNYFLGTIEVPFPSFTRNAASSAFLSFERGGQPPFATPDVNTVKVGYRIQWEGWFGQRR